MHPNQTIVKFLIKLQQLTGNLVTCLEEPFLCLFPGSRRCLRVVHKCGSTWTSARYKLTQRRAGWDTPPPRETAPAGRAEAAPCPGTEHPLAGGRSTTRHNSIKLKSNSAQHLNNITIVYKNQSSTRLTSSVIEFIEFITPQSIWTLFCRHRTGYILYFT